MRRLLAVLAVAFVLAGTLWTPGSAESAATSVDLLCTVNTDGDCLVSLSVVLRLEAAYDDMFFPLPPNAKNVTMNGNKAYCTRSDAMTAVDISKITRGYTGDAAIRFEYTLTDVVKLNRDNQDKDNASKEKRKQLQLDLPLLSGFRYPVEQINFTVTMPPGEMTNKPGFTSIYRGASIESDLVWEVRGSQIIGYSKVAMNDREGIDMHMQVSTSMFPGVSTYIREGNPELIPILIFAGLAMLYWLLFLRTLPLVQEDTVMPPAGISAGELGCRLTHSGGDLTAMVFSWAQLGYVLIHMDGNERVLLHKRMEMGNERSQFENKVFKSLFGNRRVVEGTGYHYAQLSQQVAHMRPNQRNMFQGSSGNVIIFRLLACVSQAFCGICVAMNLSDIRILQVIMAVILSAFGGITGWLMQAGAYRTHLRGKLPILVGLGCGAVWTVLGLLGGQVWIPLGCSVGQILLGYFGAYGGRRSELGRHDARQVLGLRHYLKRLPNQETSRLIKNDPDYFFNMAPYALALGVIRPFSRSFGQRKLDQCPYLITKVHGKRSAEDWAFLMQDAADLMDTRARQLRWERWTSVQIHVSRS